VQTAHKTDKKTKRERDHFKGVGETDRRQIGHYDANKQADKERERDHFKIDRQTERRTQKSTL